METNQEQILHRALKFVGGLVDEDEAVEYLNLLKSGKFEETETRINHLFYLYHSWVEQMKRLDVQWFELSYNVVKKTEWNDLQINRKGPFDNILGCLCILFLMEVGIILGPLKKFYPYYYQMECIFKYGFPFRWEMPAVHQEDVLSEQKTFEAKEWISDVQALLKKLKSHCNALVHTENAETSLNANLQQLENRLTQITTLLQ